MRQKNLKKKAGSLLLAAAMIVTSFPAFGTEVWAAEVTEPSQFATKEQLKNFDTLTLNRRNTAKLCFGNEGRQEWWIAGNQGGDSVTLFAASPLATEKTFDPNYSSSDSSTRTKKYETDWNCSYSGSTPTDVHANHYGASPLRTTLKELETSYFSTAERDLMNDTIIYTDDIKNKSVYSTTDKLYLAYGNYGDSFATVGKNAPDDLNNGLHIAKMYWGSNTFWLRAPVQNVYARLADPSSNTGLGNNEINRENAVVPAFELNLSSVLFASAVKAASSDNVESGTIADGVAQKEANATGTVSLVVQGNDGTGDWYYSVKAGKTTVVTEEQIKTACSLSGDINLADCKIWLETTTDNLAYARMAEAKTIKMIDAAALTGVKPAGGSAFPAKAFCSTEGIDANSLAITYTAKDTGAAATGTAEWNTAYQAGLTLTAASSDSTVYLFGDSVSVTVDGETAQNVLSNTNSELGRQATLTLEGSTSPNTKSVDVAWTLANSGSTAYNTAPGAGNTFKWTIAAAQIKDYDVSGCAGYDSGTGTISGTVAISNKAATPVTIIGNNQTLNFDGSTIDVSQYFTIDTNAGTRNYSLVSGTGVTGQGSLSGAVTLESGKTIVRDDETVKNDSNGTVTIDKENNGTVDVTVKLPQAGSVNIDAEGKVTVPANGTVQATGGKKLGKKSPVKTVEGKRTSVSLTKIDGKKISGKKGYKFRIKALKYIGGKKVYIGSSKIYHVADESNKKYTNAKKLELTKKKYTLQKGESVNFKVQIVKQSDKRNFCQNPMGLSCDIFRTIRK